jgi:hypothetical protein
MTVPRAARPIADYLARFYIADDIAARVRFSGVRLTDDWHPQNGNRLLIADHC